MPSYDVLSGSFFVSLMCEEDIVKLEVATFASGAFQHAEAKWGCVKVCTGWSSLTFE